MNQHIILFLCILLSPTLLSCSPEGAEEGSRKSKHIIGLQDPGPSHRFKNDKKIVQPFDLNNDNTADMWKIFERVQKHIDDDEVIMLLRKEVDMNFDTKVDIWFIYNEKEQLKEQLSDVNFDGIVDLRELYESGTITHRESYPNGFADENSTPAARKYFNDGHLFKIEIDTDGDGLIDRWEVYNDGRRTQVGFDKNSDEKVDYWEDFTQ